MQLGTLEVTASLDNLYNKLHDKALLILVAQSAKTAIVVLFTLYIFRRLVSRHLSDIADYARRLDLSNLGGALRLRRRKRSVPDELDVVVSAFNGMTSSVKRDVEELAGYRRGLEDHDAGDELLKMITACMSECARKVDTLARLGGDEFVLMLEEIDDEQDIAPLVGRLMERVCEPVALGGQEVSVICSIGISAYPQDATDAFTLLKYADTAMYHVKEKGRNGVERYCAEMHARVNEHLGMEFHLRRALERDEFRLQYQPLIDLHSGRIIGAEALVRWRHPELGLVTPARFIPLAEETGLIASIGEWVLRAACKQAKAWHDAGFADLQVSVNLSAQQLVRPAFESEVAGALAASGLPAHCLELEIAESTSMRNPEHTVLLLLKLKAMGISIAIDDFGTGYSNLSCLKRFPVDRLKLDRSFVADIASNTADSALAHAIIGMAHSLDLIVVAEGVETPVQDAACRPRRHVGIRRPGHPVEPEGAGLSGGRVRGSLHPHRIPALLFRRQQGHR